MPEYDPSIDYTLCKDYTSKECASMIHDKRFNVLGIKNLLIYFENTNIIYHGIFMKEIFFYILKSLSLNNPDNYTVIIMKLLNRYDPFVNFCISQSTSIYKLQLCNYFTHNLSKLCSNDIFIYGNSLDEITNGFCSKDKYLIVKGYYQKTSNLKSFINKLSQIYEIRIKKNVRTCVTVIMIKGLPRSLLLTQTKSIQKSICESQSHEQIILHKCILFATNKYYESVKNRKQLPNNLVTQHINILAYEMTDNLNLIWNLNVFSVLEHILKMCNDYKSTVEIKDYINLSIYKNKNLSI